MWGRPAASGATPPDAPAPEFAPVDELHLAQPYQLPPEHLSPPPSPPKPRRLRRRLRALFILATIAFIAIASVLAVAMISYTIRFPDPMTFRKELAAPLVRVLARDGTILAERGQGATIVPFEALPRHLVNAVVAIEDRRFFDHHGLDPFGMLRAAFANLRAARFVQGGSTLSQQLAKNLFLSPERTLARKLEEVLLTIWLEVRLPKAQILELYLNRVYFGAGAFGIEAASRRYFDKSTEALTLAEAAVIAGLLKAPSKYSPAANPGLARARARTVLASMLAAGLIDENTATETAQQSVRFADVAARESSGVEYAVEFALDRLPEIGSGHSSIVVETTIDRALQKRAQALVETTLATEGATAGAGQAAIVVLDADGGLRAIVGGRSFAQSQYNRASRARRQPGSAFKPIVYLAAVEQGAQPEQIVHDIPVNIGGWMPRNDSGRYQGAMTLRHALAHSVNTVAARLQQDVGTRRVIALARRLGIKSDLRADGSLALGTSEVSLLELTGAYCVLASGGVGIEPHVVRAVKSADGKLFYRRPLEQPRWVVAPDHVGSMSSMLHTALVSGTGRRAALPRHVAAGKTGTTQDHRDAWFVGYTAYLTGGVWVGNDNGEAMHHVSGGGLPAMIWRKLMHAAHEPLLPSTLPGMDQQRSVSQPANERGGKPSDAIGALLTNPPTAEASPPQSRASSLDIDRLMQVLENSQEPAR